MPLVFTNRGGGASTAEDGVEAGPAVVSAVRREATREQVETVASSSHRAPARSHATGGRARHAAASSMARSSASPLAAMASMYRCPGSATSAAAVRWCDPEREPLPPPPAGWSRPRRMQRAGWRGVPQARRQGRPEPRHQRGADDVIVYGFSMSQCSTHGASQRSRLRVGGQLGVAGPPPL
jgi:hypothetical protein